MKTKPKPRVTGGVELTRRQAMDLARNWCHYWQDSFEQPIYSSEFAASDFVLAICAAETTEAARAIVRPWGWRSKVLMNQAVWELCRKARQLVKKNGGDNGRSD